MIMLSISPLGGVRSPHRPGAGALSGHGTDLVEGRRRMRPVLALTAAVYAGAIVVMELLWRDRLFAAPTSIINAAVLIVLAFIFVLNQIGKRGAAPLHDVPGSAPAPATADVSIDPRDAPILAALASVRAEVVGHLTALRQGMSS